MEKINNKETNEMLSLMNVVLKEQDTIDSRKRDVKYTSK